MLPIFRPLMEKADVSPAAKRGNSSGSGFRRQGEGRVGVANLHRIDPNS
jgi:hypothetical protein